MKLRLHLRPVLAAVILGLIACGCGGSSGSQSERLQSPAANFPQLTAPQEALGQLRGTSAQKLECLGSDFSLPLSHNVIPSGNIGGFTSSWNSAAPDLADCAYAIYEFSLEAGDSRVLRLIHSGLQLEFTPYIGVADFTANAWTWELPESGSLDIGDRVAGDGRVLIAVLLLGPPSELSVSRLSFLEFDEVEDNDTAETANVLPGQNFAGFAASLGDPQDGSAVLDGDLDDWFEIPGTFGELQELYIDIAPTTFGFSTALDAELCSADGTSLMTGFGFGGFVSIFAEETNAFTPADLPLKLRVYTASAEEGGNYTIKLRSGYSPVAALVPDSKFGQVPLTVNFDASGSTDPDNAIVLYKWTFGDDNDGIPDLQTTVPSASHLYSATGSFEVSVEIVDETGLDGFAEDSLFFGDNPYDEIENNDNRGQAQLLDPLKSGGWLGSIGRPDSELVPDWISYDGDSSDYFKIMVPAGQSIRAEVEITNGLGPPAFDLFSLSSEPAYGESRYFDSSLQSLNNTAEEGQFSLEVEDGFDDAYGDYTLRWYTGIAPDQPSIDITIGPESNTAHFTGSGNDSDGNIATYAWDLNYDGVQDATGEFVQRTYTSEELAESIYAVLIVYDNDGLRNTQIEQVLFP